MIFIYNYFKTPDVPKDLEPLSEFIKKYNKVLAADIDTFAVFIDEVYKKFNSIPNVNKKYTLNLSDSSIAIDDNEIPFSVISISFSNILGLWGFRRLRVLPSANSRTLRFFLSPIKVKQFSLSQII